ncbi:hypothetical protein [Streptomyces sp. NBC_00859]|uniref:hypothetical protein n=1 Tax=Streptomyces sp. NBC_00859 TaxID=2903682 RepID=UPI0038678D16|nr:hypothetical protein OG584_33895 [Streptomyces sp. NBC_00859]
MAFLGIVATGIFLIDYLFVGSSVQLTAINRNQVLGSWVGDKGERITFHESGEFSSSGVAVKEFDADCHSDPAPLGWKIYKFPSTTSTDKSMNKGTAIELRYANCTIDVMSVKNDSVPKICIANDDSQCQNGIYFRRTAAGGLNAG